MVTEAGVEKKNVTLQTLCFKTLHELGSLFRTHLSLPEEDETRRYRTPECKTKFLMTERGKEGIGRNSGELISQEETREADKKCES